MGKDKITPEIVATPNFPAYSISAVANRYVIVGGGGGAARTGVKNKFDVYELYHTGYQTKAERVVSHDVGEACISNLTAWCHNDQNKVPDQVNPSIHLAIGQEEKCVLMCLDPKLSSALPVDEIALDDPIQEEESVESSPQIRQRKKQLIDAKLKENIAKKRKNERQRRESINSTLRGDQYFSFDVNEVAAVQSVFNKKKSSNGDETYQKVVRLSHNHKIVATGGTDGAIRLWSVPSMDKLSEISAHQNEVDDLDFRPDGKQIVSVSKPSKECCVWDIKTSKKVIQLVLPSNGIKYKFFRARYGVVEDDSTQTRLFTISNPLGTSKGGGLLAKWDAKQYALTKTQPLVGHLSSLAVSDNGRYVAAGTMDGTIHIMIAFSLQVLERVEDAHSMFITGLEWMPTCHVDSKMACGFSDASVLSISCDNTLKVHHIPRETVVPVWMVALLAVIVLVGCFVIGGYLGL